jgi:hypothetical protein
MMVIKKRRKRRRTVEVKTFIDMAVAGRRLLTPQVNK